MKAADFIGWGSSLVLLATLMRQVHTQWKTKATAGLSKWLFIGDINAYLCALDTRIVGQTGFNASRDR